MLTVAAVYKGQPYTATEHGERVAIHAPSSTCWTHWRRGRLVRSQALRATAPARVVSRLEERLRRAGQLGASWGAARDAGLLGPQSEGIEVMRRALAEAVQYPREAEDERGWAAWGRFLQLPETTSHEEILEAVDHPPDLELPMAGVFELDEAVQRETGRPRELTNTVSDGSRPPSYAEQWANVAASPEVTEIRELVAQIYAGASRINWARLLGMSETASREEILERFRRVQPPITQGSPAYMQALVAQITPETARLWADAWGCAPADLAERVLEPGPGGLVDSDTARELSRRILADVGAEHVEGARRADRSVLERHNDPDTVEDLEYYGDAPEPLEDVEWLRGVLAETEGPKA